MGSKISLLVYEWPLIKCKIGYMNGSIFQNLAKIGSNLRKFWKKSVILFKIWPKIEPIGIWMGYFFLEKLVFVWVYFQIPWRHIPTKNKLEYPPPREYLLSSNNKPGIVLSLKTCITRYKITNLCGLQQGGSSSTLMMAEYSTGFCFYTDKICST